MTDHLTIEKRSWNMSRIPAKNTKPEKIVRSRLHKMGFRFRIHDSKLPGKPDILLRKYKTAVFVHGCFWHQHPGCKRASKPKSNKAYWIKKLEKNKIRFIKINKDLKKLGWNVVIIWECETKNYDRLIKIIETSLYK